MLGAIGRAADRRRGLRGRQAARFARPVGGARSAGRRGRCGHVTLIMGGRAVHVLHIVKRHIIYVLAA